MLLAKIAGATDKELEELQASLPPPQRQDEDAWAFARRIFLATCYDPTDEQLSSRHLNQDTARRFGLKWNAVERKSAGSDWGMPWKDKMWLPVGLVIPAPGAIRIRRPEGDPRYAVVAGSKIQPWVAEAYRAPMVVVESELCGMLVWQETRGSVSVLMLGSAQVRPDRDLFRRILSARAVLVATDNDAAGEEAWEWWGSSFGHAKRLRPRNKDPTDSHAVHPTRQWIEEGLK